MKQALRLTGIVALLVIITSQVLAYSAAYPYTINGNSYSVQGFTTKPGTLIIDAGTQGFAQPGSPPINFQKLVLETRIWRLEGTNCSLGQKKFREVNSTLLNTTSTTHTVYAPSSSAFWYGVSKHKLVHAGATNSDGNSPSAFYTEPTALSSQLRYKGSGVSCP